MSYLTLILGESGTGKSTSIRNLDPDETFIINVIGKPMPFRGFNKKYSSDKKNYMSTDDYSKIIKAMEVISSKEDYKNIKNIVIDDFQYIMCNEFMRRASEKGYNKFTEIGQNAWRIADDASKLRDDIFVFVLSHSEVSDQGVSKAKTIGKMLDNTITFEGLFTTVMHSKVIDGKYRFLTNFDGSHVAKSPMGMFEDMYIDNDLNEIKKSMINYYSGDAKDAIQA